MRNDYFLYFCLTVFRITYVIVLWPLLALVLVIQSIKDQDYTLVFAAFNFYMWYEFTEPLMGYGARFYVALPVETDIDDKPMLVSKMKITKLQFYACHHESDADYLMKKYSGVALVAK